MQPFQSRFWQFSRRLTVLVIIKPFFLPILPEDLVFTLNFSTISLNFSTQW